MSLEEVCELIVDTEHKTAPRSETGYPSIRTPNIGRGRFLLDGVFRVSEETYQKWTRRAVPQANDLILAREAPVGNVAVIPEGLNPCLGQRTVLLRVNPTIVSPRFLCYYLLSDKIQNIIQGLSGGATVDHLNMKDIRQLELGKIPPLPIQQKIASILSAYDDLIENNLKRIRLLEEAAQNLYREWFVHLRFPGHESARWQGNGLPEGWEKINLYDFAEVQMGFPFKAEDFNEDNIGTPAIRIRDIPNHWTKTYTTQDAKDEYKTSKGDIVIGMDGFFYTDVWCGQDDAFLVQRVCRIRAKNPDFQGYLLEALKPLIHFYEQTISGATVAHLGAKHLKEIFITLPTPEIQSRLGIFKSLMLQKIKLRSETISLKEARDILLPRLMNQTIAV